ncbi:Lipocalin/cytosolic fatty-acid binding protein family protein [Aphelenchoides bicaudatus]|nr:Lipocalin/cytosolic fatty-acid binding protein family protein [Aphelenchoides bicaudatus]
MSANSKHLKMVGQWKFESAVNFEEYLKVIGINPVKRKLALLSRPNLCVEINGDLWTSKVESLLKSMEWTFKPGEQFEAKTVDGRKFKVTVVLGEDGTVTEHQENISGDSSPCSKIIRYVDENDQLIAICQAKDVESRRVYSRIVE